MVKAHPGHPETSRASADLVRQAVADAALPAGVFQLIEGKENGVVALKDHRIRAASFTGSVPGGRALLDIANQRETPIPFYAEMGSLNPVVVTPLAGERRGAQVVSGFVESFTLGVGQFCTKPGRLFLPEGHGLAPPAHRCRGGNSARTPADRLDPRPPRQRARTSEFPS